jgi:hypothetical protein
MKAKHFKAWLFGIFAFTFSLTALITLLGITEILPIKDDYLGPLFTVLILELVVAFITLFKKASFFEPEITDTGTPSHPLPYRPSRLSALTGTWKGEAQQAFGPTGDPFTAKLFITFDDRTPRVRGSGRFRVIFEGQEEDYGIELVGGFLLDSFLRLEYNSVEPNMVQFGSIILELEPDGKTLNGRYHRYGIKTKKIIFGLICLKKVP